MKYDELVDHALQDPPDLWSLTAGRATVATSNVRCFATYVIALMRRDYLAPTEAKVYEQQLAIDGLWKPPAPPQSPAASGGAKPVSLRAKVIASILCCIAFIGPVYFLLVFANAQGPLTVGGFRDLEIFVCFRVDHKSN